MLLLYLSYMLNENSQAQRSHEFIRSLICVHCLSELQERETSISRSLRRRMRSSSVRLFAWAMLWKYHIRRVPILIECETSLRVLKRTKNTRNGAYGDPRRLPTLLASQEGQKEKVEEEEEEEVLCLVHQMSQDLRIKFSLLRVRIKSCLLYTSPSPRDGLLSRMPSSA
eukprot:TRINITY_DN258_c0_g1_i2.p4 TRINITY_DN258_c0_g1~~TRINITY_DN258_c0_g1_i2.p4  ORF type:complete len:169 (-),score=25.93 TRINITY_DN258_c0_g1_i2:54-560(-)